MDIVFTDREKEIMEEYNQEPDRMILLPPETKKCTIEFNITDIAKFEVFAEQIFARSNANKLTEQCGCTFSLLSRISLSDKLSQLKQEMEDILSKY